MLRFLAIVGGLGLLAATAHVTIIASGGYAEPHAVLTIAVAAGVGLGALCIGHAWSERRYALALAIGFALLAGEAFGLLMTGERVIVAREAAQAPLRAATATTGKALAQVSAAESALAGAPSTSPRLTAALAAKAIADAAVTAKASERSCAANCAALLQSQADAASREVNAARADLAADRRRLEADLAAAREALAALPPPKSATPLADRLGLPAWALDLGTAALGALGANGLGACLLAFGAHGRRRHVPQAPTRLSAAAYRSPLPAEIDAAIPTPAGEPVAPRPVFDVRQHAAQFGVERLTPDPAGRVSLAEMHGAYRSWCAATGSAQLPAAEIAGEMARLLSGAGLGIEASPSGPILVGVRLKPGTALAVAA